MNLKLKQYPDLSLLTPCQDVDLSKHTIPELLELTDKMLEVMYLHRGVGLSANQVGVDARVTVIDVSKNGKSPIRMVNPVIFKLGVEDVRLREGCLSFPGVFVDHARKATCSVHYLDPSDKMGYKEIECTGILAVCVQHEVDHLNGTTMIDGVSQLKRQRALAQLRKNKP